jgi:hypothetical protein
MSKIFGISDLPVSTPFSVLDSRSLVPKPVQTAVSKPIPPDKFVSFQSQKLRNSQVSVLLKRFTTKSKNH